MTAGRARAALRAVGPGILASLLACGGGGSGGIPVVGAPPVAEGPALATFVLVGDTIAHGMDPGADPLADVAPWFDGADAFVLNHEGVLEARPLPGWCAALPNQSLLDADPRSADAYARAPAVVATLANNHVLDCSGAGLLGTGDALRARGFLTAGAGLRLADACEPARFAAGALDVACAAYLAMDADYLLAGERGAGAAAWASCGGPAAVAALKAEGAFVVASLHLHLGPSWTAVTAPEHRALVREVLDAGADVVVAHGPHVRQGVLVRGGRVGFLSLGNFLFAQDAPLADAARDVVVARVTVHPRQVLVALFPARLDETGRPRPASGASAGRILEALHRASRGEGTSLVRSGDVAYALIDR